jgi:putative ABC transport system permease protein
VIGSIEPNSQAGDHELDRRAYVPLSTVRLLNDDRYLTAILVRPVSNQMHARAVDQIRKLLAFKHRFAPEDQHAVRIVDIIKTLTNFNTLATSFKIVWGLLGAITLAVGGVGVMNIMFVSVIERTREIGIRKAVGARHRDIAVQFLAESVAITLTGGIGGVLLGVLACQFLPSINIGDARAGFDISLRAVLAALALLTAVGILAGVWPALRAARLQPLEALRYE